jgi:Tfp pilus assembly protein PilF/4-amino-4-deoxy-L-arabinose transferase-like glycosyltransferase
VKESKASRRFRSADKSGDAPRYSDRTLFVAVVVCAFFVRLVYLFQIESIPLFYHLPGDPRTYDQWAQHIAAGYGLGQGVFYQTPLYPCFLALLQLWFGHNLWSIRVAQIFLGAVACGLVFWAAKSLFSRGAAVAAGLIVSLYAPAIFYNGLIDKPALDLFLIGLLLVLLSRALKNFHWANWIGLGLVLALLGLSRENALLLAPVILVWIWIYFRDRPMRTRLNGAGIFVLGLMLVLLSVGLRNLFIGGEFTLTTSQLGPNFFIGNNPDADGTYASIRAAQGVAQFERKEATRLAERAEGRPLSSREVSRYWLARSWDYIRSQPLGWLALMGKKWLVVWNVREIEDSDDFYLYQKWSRLLRVLGSINHFGLLAPLAAVGIFLTWSESRRLWLFYASLFTLAFSVALFFVFGRYRFSMVPFLALFAGAGVVGAFDLFQRRGIRELLLSAAIASIVAVVVRLPVVDKAGLSAPGYNNLAIAFSEEGKTAEAIESLKQAVRLQPSYGVARFNLANLYAKAGRLEEAAEQQREAVRLYPHFAAARNNLGQILATQGDMAGAVEQFRKSLEVDPSLGDPHFNLGVILGKQGRTEEALYHFGRVLKPSLAYYNVGRVAASQGRWNEAAGLLRQALAVEPELAEARETLAQVLSEQGKNDKR